MDFVYVHKQIK